MASQRKRGLFTIGLLSNCNGLMGMLAGLQKSGRDWKPLRVGLVYCDAHGDFNTPETTLSGMLGGMPVAVSTGLCLSRLRMECGLDPSLPTKYVTMLGLRDLDPLERELMDRTEVKHITVEDMKILSPSIDLEIKRLSSLVDLIYVHVDLDVLLPEEVPGHNLRVEGGPSSRELADALARIFEYPKMAAFGVASYPAGRDPDRKTLKAVHNLRKSITSLPTKYVTMLGLRDLDPLERELMDRTEVKHITVEDMKILSPSIDLEIKRLSSLVDLIYVHVDLDVLLPEEVPGHNLRVEGGPSSRELADALARIFEYPKMAAFGVASYPAGRDPDRKTLKAVHNLIRGVLEGLKNRDKRQRLG
ncbi:arginase family protein [Candidatus Bathyarchaeota archaeon]|nr:arginase family protein [Candidatus Bathyarchaeota archaeon]